MRLFGAVAVAWLISVGYTFYLNPEVRYFERSAQIKQLEARRLTRAHGHKLLVYGGSSCTFSIDADQLQARHNLPAVNMGLGAGMGAGVLTQWVLSETQPGDTLIVALEPDLLTENDKIPALGKQFSFAMNSPSWLSAPWESSRDLNSAGALLALRPGGDHLFALAAKILFHKPLYRYKACEISAGGWAQTDIRLAVDSYPGPKHRLTPASERMLRWLSHWCESNDVKVAYSLPWAYVAPSKEAALRESNAAFILQVSERLPVLYDRRLGAVTNASFFADTNWHLTETAADPRTAEFAEQVRRWSLWTKAQLLDLRHAPNDLSSSLAPVPQRTLTTADK